MKKTLYLFIILALLFTGCGTKEKEEPKDNNDPTKDSRTAKQVVLDAVDKMESFDNYHGKMKMVMVVGDEDFNFTVTAESNIDYDEKNKTSKEISTTKMGDEEKEELSYKTYDDKLTTTYTKGEDDKWYKSSEETVSNLDFINKMTDITEVTSEISGRKFKLVLPKDAIMELFGEDFEEEDTQFNVEDAEMYVYISADGYFTKIILKLPMTMSFSGISMATNSELEIDYADFNTNGNVTIPQNILDNAIESKD